MAVKAASQISLIDITDAYSVTLTSEAYTFVGNTAGAPSGLSCTTQAVAYCGNTVCKIIVGTITCPIGISASVSDNNTISPTITFKTTATISAACEATIPLTIDGVTITKKFSFAVAKTGATGASGKGIKSTTITYQAGASGKTAPTGTWVTSPPETTAALPYLWTRTVFTYTDNTTSTSYSVGATTEGIQVGGRNLAQKTSSKYYVSFSKFNGNDNVCFSIGNTLTDGLSVGDTISIKLVCKYTNLVAVSGKTPQVRIVGAGNITSWNDNGYFPPNDYTKLSGSNGEVTIMYQAIINANHVKNSYWNTLLRTDSIQSGTIQCKMFKVERGTKYTDWSPAPEDTDNKISDVWQGVNDVYDDYSEFKENTYTKADMDTKLTETKEAVLISANATYQRQDAMGNYYTVSQANSAINARANQIEAKVSAIKIGGRNLIIRTGELVNKSLQADGSTNDYDKTNVMGSKISVVPGEELTFHKDNGSEWFRWNWYDSEGKFMSRMPNQNNLFTWKVPDGAYFILVSYPNTGNVKVERGNRATDWTLAPEDTDAKIDDISIGGRNLIKTTDLTVGWIDDTGALRYTADWDKTFLTGEYISVDAEKEYMFQLFWTDNNTEAWIVYAYYNSNKEFIKVATNDVYNTDKYYKEKITIPSGVAYMRISWEFGAQRAVKLEKGNKATDWTAAPEDIEAKIALKVDEKSLKSAIEAIADTINITARGGLNISGNRFTLTSTNTTITADGTITSRGTGLGSDGNKYSMAATLRGGELKVWNNTSNNGVRIQGHALLGYDNDGTNTIQLIYTPSDDDDMTTGLWLYSNLGQEIHVTRKEIWLQGNNSDGSIYGYCNIGKGYMRIDSSGTSYYGDCALSVLGGAKIQDLHAMDSMTVGCDVEKVKMWNTYFGYCQPVTAATNRVTLKWTGAALQVWIDDTLVGTLFE
jgi:hypothetical protein|nr:MAG TPA: Minor structural protein 4 [Caudoviricetes sp.]